MAICAKFAGRDALTCTRGVACACKQSVAYEILSKVGFPRRGTADESLDIFSAADLIQRFFTSEELIAAADRREG